MHAHTYTLAQRHSRTWAWWTHVTHALKHGHGGRCRCVPFRKNAGWRDFMGDEHVASLLQPMMIELTPENLQGDIGDGEVPV